MVDGKNYTSNLTKLFKHLDKLKNIQEGKPGSPVMIHMSLTNRCNLECTYCCYGLRDLSQELGFDKAESAIKQFGLLGTKGLELTGGGDPSMYKRLDDVVQAGVDNGMDVGLITNGIKLDRFGDFYKNLQWMRVSLPGSDSTLEKVVGFTDKYKIPTRLTPDLTLGKDSIDEMMPYVGKQLAKFKAEGRAEYLFLSDFNVKTTREHDNCYMHLVKPFVFTDGWVYDCPSLALSPDNKLNVNEKFRVCTIDDITEKYSKPSSARVLNCEFCKYASQNEFVHDLKMDVKHKNFA